MISLCGEYECKIDERGRFKLPQRLINDLGDRRNLDFVLNRGFDGKNLIMYPREVWDEKVKEINQLSIYDKRQRDALRYFYSGATEVSNDNADRILIPTNLKDFAQVDKDIVLLAYKDIIEIWSAQHYHSMINSFEPADLSSVIHEVVNKPNVAPNNV